MKIANIMYRLSCFSDYSSLNYNKDDVIKILNTFDNPTVSPITVQEVHSDGSLSQRMHFFSQDNLFMIAINSDRIDITLFSNKKEGFANEEISITIEKFTKSIKNLYTIFNDRVSSPHRLAWNTSYIYFEISDIEIKEFRNKFLKELNFFKDTSLNDNIIRYAIQKNKN